MAQGFTRKKFTKDYVTEADLTLSDLTTADVSTTKHGFAPKAPSDATKFLDGTGAYSTPTGGGGSLGNTLQQLSLTGSSFSFPADFSPAYVGWIATQTFTVGASAPHLLRFESMISRATTSTVHGFALSNAGQTAAYIFVLNGPGNATVWYMNGTSAGNAVLLASNGSAVTTAQWYRMRAEIQVHKATNNTLVWNVGDVTTTDVNATADTHFNLASGTFTLYVLAAATTDIGNVLLYTE